MVVSAQSDYVKFRFNCKADTWDKSTSLAVHVTWLYQLQLRGCGFAGINQSAISKQNIGSSVSKLKEKLIKQTDVKCKYPTGMLLALEWC